MIAAAAAQYGVSPSLALAVAQQESGLNPNLTSSAGAQGVMQLMPATSAQYGVTDPFDPTQNVNAGVQYLSALLSQFGGDTVAALAAYDWGPGNVQRAIAAYGSDWLSYAPAETQNYVASITGVAPAPAPAAPTPTEGAAYYIDPDTGEALLIPSDDESAAAVTVSPTQILLLTALGIGGYFLLENAL